MITKSLFKKIITVAENQRVLVFKNQELSEVLTTGKHKINDFRNELEFVTFDINALYFSEKNAERLYRNSNVLKAHIAHFTVEQSEVGLLYLNGQLRGIVAPGEQLYLWQDAGDIRLDKINIADDIAVNKNTMFLINKAGANSATRLIRSEYTMAVKPIYDVQIKNEHVGLLYIDGELIKTLSPGQYGFWQFARKVEVKQFDCRAQLLDISGQEILSKDRVSLRINLNASILVENPELAASSVDEAYEFVYKTLQLALREAIGTKALDDLLLDKLYVNETIKSIVQEPLEAVGVKLLSVGMKDIILPGEMKAILNQVVEAQKAAEANVIKRREETAATRSLHNTAKVMENNPTLMRLKELEALEKVADRIDSLTVYGGLEGLMNGVVKIA